MNTRLFYPRRASILWSVGAAAAALVLTIAAQAQNGAGTDHHRAVFTEVNNTLKHYQEVKAEHKDDDLTFELQAWFDGNVLRKIIATVPGEDGGGAEEFYLEKDLPLFVFRHYQENDGQKVEDRFYFTDGRLTQWLGTEKKAVSPKSADFKHEAERLTGNCAKFVQVLKGKGGGGKAKGNAAEKTTTGTFLGIEEGDYAHWKMRAESGEEVSYFILRPDATVDAVLGKPAKFVGKKCRVRWNVSNENLPEAGGKMRIEQLLSVEWL